MKIKTSLILVGVIAISFFIFQKIQVGELNRAQKTLQQKLQTKEESTLPRAKAQSSNSSGLSKRMSKRYQTLRAELVERAELAARLTRSNPDEPVYANQEYIALGDEIVTGFFGLTAQDVMQIIGSEPFYLQLGEDKIDLRPDVISYASRVLSQQDPKEGVFLYNEFAGEFKYPKDFSAGLRAAFQGWSITFHEEAYAWYVEELAAGNSNLRPLTDLALSLEVLRDPSEELEKISNIKDSQEAADASSPLLSAFLQRADLANQQRLLTALKQAQKKHPDSEALDWFRQDYFYHLWEILKSEHFEIATQFMAQNFTPEEMNSFGYNLYSGIRSADPAEPAKWASWVVKNCDHEACERFLLAWGKKDPEAVEEWLKTQPESPLKTTLSKNHHNQLAGKPSPFAKADSMKPSVTIGE